MGQGPLNPLLGVVPPIIETKAAHRILSTDRSPGSDELHDPAPTHVSSEESNYILETAAGTRNEASRRLWGGMGVRACVRNEQIPFVSQGDGVETCFQSRGLSQTSWEL